MFYDAFHCRLSGVGRCVHGSLRRFNLLHGRGGPAIDRFSVLFYVRLAASLVYGNKPSCALVVPRQV